MATPIGWTLPWDFSIHCGSVHLTSESIIIIKCLVNAAAIVPESQCSGLPTQAATEGWLSDMLLEESKQTLRPKMHYGNRNNLNLMS